MTSLFLALVLQSQPLSLDALAPLSQLALHLKKDHQVQLTYPPALEDQVVFVKFNQVRVSEGMERLASALDCKALYKEGKWVLERDLVLLAKRKAEEKEERRRQWQKHLDKMALQAKAEFKTVLSSLKTVNPAEDDALTFKNPSGRLMFRLLDSIGAAKLAELEPHSITTFSTSPGSQNKPFSPLVRQFAVAYDKEREELRLGLDQLGPQLTNHFLFADPKQRDPLFNQTSEIALTAFIWQNQRLHLTTYDISGARISAQVEIFWGPIEVEPQFLGTDSPLTLPDSANSISSHDYAWERTAEEANTVWQLMKQEPLDLFVRPSLAQLAENHKANLAMAVPDSAHAALAAAKPKTEKALILALAGAGLRLNLQGGWLTSEYKNQSQLGTLNLNRPALADLAKSWKEKGLARLRARLVFAARHPDAARRTDLDEWLAQNVVSPIRGGYPFPLFLEPELQRAIGAMTDSEWNSFLSGRPVMLKPTSRSAVDLAAATHGREFLSPGLAIAFPDQMRNGAFAFANGTPLSISLQGTVKQIPSLISGLTGKDPIDIEAAARAVAYNVTNPNETEIESALRGAAVLGMGTSLRVRVAFDDDLSFEQEQAIESFEESEGPKLFKDWPKELRDQFLGLVKEAFAKRYPERQAQPPF